MTDLENLLNRFEISLRHAQMQAREAKEGSRAWHKWHSQSAVWREAVNMVAVQIAHAPVCHLSAIKAEACR